MRETSKRQAPYTLKVPKLGAGRKGNEPRTLLQYLGQKSKSHRPAGEPHDEGQCCNFSPPPRSCNEMPPTLASRKSTRHSDPLVAKTMLVGLKSRTSFFNHKELYLRLQDIKKVLTADPTLGRPRRPSMHVYTQLELLLPVLASLGGGCQQDAESAVSPVRAHIHTEVTKVQHRWRALFEHVQKQRGNADLEKYSYQTPVCTSVSQL